MAFRTQAHGGEIAVAAPHYLAGHFALNSYFTRDNPNHAAAVCFLSSAFNLPYLCGLGGDAVIVGRTHGGNVFSFNGLGKSGSGQSLEHYRELGVEKVPFRGMLSTIVYGAPYAFDRFIKRANLGVSEVLDDLCLDVAKPKLISPYARGYINKYRADLLRSRNFQRWQAVFGVSSQSISCTEMPNKSLVGIVRKEGLQTFYKGTIAEKFLDTARIEAPGVFLQRDLEDFTANTTDTACLSFLGTKIYCHSGMTPWLELALMLAVIEKDIEGYSRFDGVSMLRWCRLAGAIDTYLERHRIKRCELDSAYSVNNFIAIGAQHLIDELRSCESIKPIWGKSSNTIFLAVAHADGTLIGITSSIFTPFGAMVDPGDSGVLLSNRGFAFSDDKYSPRKLIPEQTPYHTINSLVAENSEIVFTLGTTGGSVQVQVLSQLLVRVLHLKESPQAALEAPRFANMGRSNRHHYTLLSYERRCSSLLVSERFYPLPGLTSTMGVAQIAGIDRKSGSVFSASDPRGEGVALAY